MKLTAANATINTISVAEATIGAASLNSNITVGNVVLSSNQLSVGNSVVNRFKIDVPQLNLSGSLLTGPQFGAIVNTQIFTANGTWTNPISNTVLGLTGDEQVFVMLWGGGGGATSNSSTSSRGGGGAFLYGYYTLSSLANTISVIVGLGGTNAYAATGNQPTAGNGGNSVFNTTLIAYGGAGGNATGGGGGGGSLGIGVSTTGGEPLGGTSGTPGTNSTFGGAGGGLAGGNGGSSVYGGGGGSRGATVGGNSIFGGGGGSGAFNGGTSIFGGAGGNTSVAPGIPGGGGGSSSTIQFSGARGEVRVWVIGKTSLTTGP